MVLPGCSTSQRGEAVEAEQMLAKILTSPADAAERQAAIDIPVSGTSSDKASVLSKSERAYTMHQRINLTIIQTFNTRVRACLLAVAPQCYAKVLKANDWGHAGQWPGARKYRKGSAARLRTVGSSGLRSQEISMLISAFRPLQVINLCQRAGAGSCMRPGAATGGSVTRIPCRVWPGTSIALPVCLQACSHVF